jgi:3-phenylpropionate/cinnamic acid dioxygenase small subunit
MPGRELSPHEAIGQLLARYAELIDAGDFAGVGDLLGEIEVTMDDGTVVATGPDEIRHMYETTTRRFDDGTPRTQHVITNLIVEPVEPGEGGPAVYEARSRFTVFQATDGVALQPIVAGRYRDRFERAADGWRFAERCMIPTLFGDVSQHLLFDPAILS